MQVRLTIKVHARETYLSLSQLGHTGDKEQHMEVINLQSNPALHLYVLNIVKNFRHGLTGTKLAHGKKLYVISDEGKSRKT